MQAYNDYNSIMMQVNADVAKDFGKKMNQMAFADAKDILYQKVMEKRKEQVEEVAIRGDGDLEIVTLNLDIDAKKRRVCNFKHPCLTRLYSSCDIGEYFALECEVESRKKEIFLSEEKMGDPVYLLKKLNSKGCEIYASSRKLQKEYVLKILVLLRNNCSRDCCIPDEHGWRTLPDGTLEFVEEDKAIWEDIKTWAK